MTSLAALLLTLGLLTPGQAQWEEKKLTPKDLRHILDHGLWHDRVRALYGVGALGRDGLPLLRHSADDADWQVRLAVVHFLGKVGEPAIPELARFANHEDCTHVRLSALRWLAYLGAPAKGEYEAALTPEDAKLMGIIPERYGNANMGKPQTVDPPEGFMTPSFFDGGLDLRVCASSERSGRRRGGRPEPEREETVAVPNSHESQPMNDLPAAKPPEMYDGPKPPPAAPEHERPPTEYLPPGYPPPWRGPSELAAAKQLKPAERALETDEITAALGEKQSLPPGPPAPAREEPTVESAKPASAPDRDLKTAAVRRVPPGERQVLPPGGAGVAPRPPLEAPSRLEADAGSPEPENDPLPVLLEQLRGKEPRRRARAADELGKRRTPGDEVVDALRLALGDRDRRVRASAALALGNVAQAERGLVKELKLLLRDRDADVRLSAALALQRLSNRTSVP